MKDRDHIFTIIENMVSFIELISRREIPLKIRTLVGDIDKCEYK